jgi:dethiobiotin synthetase
VTGWFITATDTGVGKTLAACSLLHALRAAGLRAAGMKPVASGCAPGPDGPRNADAEALIAAAGADLAYADVNPYALPDATAPALAARAAGVAIRLDVIAASYARLASRAERVVVEGVGGWRVPLGDGLELPDVARALALPVILVVGIRLGALNHALLSWEAIAAAGLARAGWVANRLDADPRLDGYLESLCDLLGEAPLAALPHARPPDPARLAVCWDLARLR